MVIDVLFHDYKGKNKILELIYGEKKNFQNLPDSPLNGSIKEIDICMSNESF